MQRDAPGGKIAELGPEGRLRNRTGGIHMERIAYVGLDLHKKTVAWCAKDARGRVLGEGTIGANRRELEAWRLAQRRPWIGAMEATLFTGWVYDFLAPHARELKVAHPLRVRAIATAKKKN